MLHCLLFHYLKGGSSSTSSAKESKVPSRQSTSRTSTGWKEGDSCQAMWSEDGW
jgi:hypothetical protein